jgi:hypothetical protein
MLTPTGKTRKATAQQINNEPTINPLFLTTLDYFNVFSIYYSF